MTLHDPPLDKLALIIWWHIRSQADVGRGKQLITDFTSKMNGFHDPIDLGPTVPEFNPPLMPFIKKELRHLEKDVRLTISNESIKLEHFKKDYNWSEFHAIVNTVVKKAHESLEDIFKEELDHVHLEIKYENFFLNESKLDVLEFVADNFNLRIDTIKQDSNNPIGFGLVLAYEKEELGDLRLDFGVKNKRSQQGVVFDIELESNKVPFEVDEMMQWIEKSKTCCHKSFFSFAKKYEDDKS